MQARRLVAVHAGSVATLFVILYDRCLPNHPVASRSSPSSPDIPQNSVSQPRQGLCRLVWQNSSLHCIVVSYRTSLSLKKSKNTKVNSSYFWMPKSELTSPFGPRKVSYLAFWASKSELAHFLGPEKRASSLFGTQK